MSESSIDGNVISETMAQEIASNYLHARYYNSKRISFNSCESVSMRGVLIYRFHGDILEKSTNMLDRIARDKKASTYKFMLNMNSQNGEIINYEIY